MHPLSMALTIFLRFFARYKTCQCVIVSGGLLLVVQSGRRRRRRPQNMPLPVTRHPSPGHPPLPPRLGTTCFVNAFAFSSVMPFFFFFFEPGVSSGVSSESGPILICSVGGASPFSAAALASYCFFLISSTCSQKRMYCVSVAVAAEVAVAVAVAVAMAVRG